MVSSAMPPIAVYLGAVLVNRIAEARLHALTWRDMLPIIIGLWVATGVQRAIGAYMGYGRNLFVRRVQLEAERRLLAQASKVDLGHFDNSDWHDRLARAKRDVSWRPGDLTWSVLGLSGNIVTIVLMAALLASLHWVLVLLALAAAVLSLALERRVTVAGSTSSSTRRRPKSASASTSATCSCSRARRRRFAPTCWRTTCSAAIAIYPRSCSGSASRCIARARASRCSPGFVTGHGAGARVPVRRRRRASPARSIPAASCS